MLFFAIYGYIQPSWKNSHKQWWNQNHKYVDLLVTVTKIHIENGENDYLRLEQIQLMVSVKTLPEISL